MSWTIPNGKKTNPQHTTNNTQKKKPSAVAGEGFLLFRDLSWSQGPKRKGDCLEAMTKVSRASRVGATHSTGEGLLTLLLGGLLLRGFLSGFLCHNVVTSFLVYKNMGEQKFSQ